MSMFDQYKARAKKLPNNDEAHQSFRVRKYAILCPLSEPLIMRDA